MTKETEGFEEKPKLWTRSFIMVTLANFFLFCGFGMLPSLLPLHFRDLGAPESIIGFVAGVYTVACVIMRPLVGVAIDRWGRKGVLGVGLIIMCVASILFALLPVLGLILVIRFIQGIGWGMANTASPTLASDIIPQKRFAEGMSWFTQGNAIASVLAPGASLAIYYSFGAQVSVTVSACFFALAFVCSRFVKTPDELAEQKATAAQEGQAALKPEAQEAQAAGLQTSTQAASAVREEAGGAPKPRGRVNLKTFFEQRSILPACIMFFVTACYGAMTSFVPVMSEFRGIAGVQWFFVIEALAVVASRPFMGKLVDRKGYRPTAIVGMAGMCLSMLTLSFASNFPTLALGAVFNGVGYATCYATFQTMAVAGIEKARRGSATATFYVGYDSGMGLGAVIAGLVSGAVGYAIMYRIFACLPIAALIILFINADKVKTREEARK